MVSWGMARIGVVASGLSLAALAMVVLASSEGVGNPVLKPKAACTDARSGDRSFRIRPRRCDFVKRGEFANAYTVDTRGMKWRRWGKRAKGHGQTFVNMDGYRRVNVTLRRPVRRCGRRVYSRGVFRIPAYNATVRYRLYTC
jgi:hypothetical protein